MRFERTIEIEATRERVWEVLTDFDAWPKRIETVTSVEVVTPGPAGVGTRVRLQQPKLPEGFWDVTTWDAPTSFEWKQQSTGVKTVAGHRVEALPGDRSRLTLTLEMNGFLIPIMGRFVKDLTNRYMGIEAEAMKRAAEAAG